jgi:hypothetical protein
MKKRNLGLFVLCALVGSAGAFGEVVKEKSISFLVTYPDKSTETVLVSYTATLDASQETQGSASKPFEGHPIDDRHCVFSVNTNVKRKAYLVSRSGQLAEIPGIYQVFDSTKYNSRGPSNLIQAIGYHQTCGDVQGVINSDIASAKQAIINGFDGIVQEDEAKLDKDLSDFLHPVSVKRKPNPDAEGKLTKALSGQ